MDICNIQSVQRVVNFTSNNGKMLRAEQPQAIMPSVTMICDLPLLFMNGIPTCLEDLSLEQLEKFVPYMINCSGVSPGIKPNWWPHDMEFSVTPVRISDMSDSKWLLTLKNLVLNCYSSHGCDYALKLCAKNSHECHSEWTLVDGLDGTMYLYNKRTRKIMTAFESANKMCTRRKRTFSNSTPAKENTNYVSKRRKKLPIQVHLCKTCDAEFRSLVDMQAHEKGCYQKCSFPVVPTQENVAQIRVRNKRVLIPDLKLQTVSSLDQPPCFLQHLKNRTERKALKLADHNKSQELFSNERKRLRNNFDSSEKMQHHETHGLKNVIVSDSSLTQISCQFSLNLISPLSNDDDNGLGSRNVSQKPGTLMKSSSSRKRMSLMPRKLFQEELSKQKSKANVYVCHNCDGEFSSSSEVRHHEIDCKTRMESLNVSISEDDTQECFLKYFCLSSSSALKPSLASRGKSWFRNPMRYSSIPVSSPLGNLIHGRSQVPTAAISSKMEKIERYCLAKQGEVFKPLGTKQNPDDWRVSWKSRQSTIEYSKHSYLYPTQRWWEMPLIRKLQMKEEKKERLLRICKSTKVSVRKMSNEEVLNYTSCRRVSVQICKLSWKEIRYYTRMNSTKKRTKKYFVKN